MKLLITALIILPFLGFYLGVQYSKSSSSTSPTQKQNFQPFDFTLLGTADTIPRTTEFRDKELEASFKYPESYFMRSVPSDPTHPYVTLFFSIDSNSETIKSINTVSDCEQNNRRDPSGNCREGTVGDFEIIIENVTALPSEKDENCTESKVEGQDGKMVLSCLESTLSGSPAPKYYIYYNRANGGYLKMTINVANLYDAGDAIKLIGETFSNK